MNLDYLILALKNLKHRGIRSWLTLLGIFIGVTAVVALIGLGSGLEAAVGAQFGISSTEVITVQAGGVNAFGAPGSGAVNKLTTDDAEEIEKLSSVEMAIPRNIETIRVEYNDKLSIMSALSIPYGEQKKRGWEVMDLEAEKGRLLQDSDLKKVVLGNSFSKDSNGFDKIIETGDKILINGEKFEVVGILKKKGSLIFDNVVFVNNDVLEDLTGYGDEVDLIAVVIKNPELMDKAAEDITKLLRKQRDVKEGEEDFEVSTPEAMMETVNSILGGVQAFIIIIASISILVGAIGIVNTMTTSVLERKKEIGIMKAIGATNFQVFLQFFFESGMLGLMGGIIGAILGTLISIGGVAGINNFIGSELSPVIDFWLIGGALVGSFSIGALAGIIPAMNASKQNPVEALRG